MKFRTSIEAAPASFSITHKDQFLLAGSCFSENIGSRLEHYQFKSRTNPLGIAFNPISLHSLLSMKKEAGVQDMYLNHHDVCFNYQFHSAFSSLDKEQLRSSINAAIQQQRAWLSKSNILIISYGTAWVYRLKESGSIVNNCHKQAAKLFEKHLLSIDEIVQSWTDTYSLLSKVHNKDFKVIFTVSPVRHLKDGFHENQLSKASLLLAVDKICQQHAECFYFPSYELLMDDLRDYRYFEKDLLHPNTLAIDYIWDFFTSTYFDEVTQIRVKQIEQLKQSLMHKPFHSNSKQHQLFLEQLLVKLKRFSEEAGISFASEIAQLESQLNTPT
jgi:hypothetical protein